MADYRIKLSDGVDTIDLYGGSDTIIRDAGFGLLPPNAVTSFIGNPTFDGNRLGQSRYGNRRISITVKIVGTTVSDLKDNIRTVQRLLNDAQERTLLGYGSQVFLEYQWGDTINDSVFYDVIRGDLSLPRGFQAAAMANGFTIPNATLNLICKPFGRYIEQNIAQDTLENEDYSTNHNYQDITTTAAYGDVPAPMYLRLAMTDATDADRKVWIAKRSGLRQKDDLWFQGEDETSTTGIIGAHTVTFTDEADAALSGEKYKRIDLATDDGITADTKISRFNYDINTLPRGQFRVLIYCQSNHYESLAWAFGWSYGDKSYTPTLANGEYYLNSTDDTWEILDLGILNIPPIAESDIAINNVFQLRIFQIAKFAIGITTPTGHDDPGNTWNNELKAYDGVVAQKANSDAIVSKNWNSDELELTHAGISVDSLRYYASGETADITQVDLDAEYDASWHHVYEGVFTQNTWETKALGGYHTVTKMRLKFYNNHAVNNYKAYIHEVDFGFDPSQWDLDYIFLLPIDEGVVIIDDVAKDDVIAIDAITDPPNVFILGSTNDIENFPDYVGNPFTLGREPTRIYVLRDDDKDVTFSSDVKYQPRFMVV